MARHNSLGGLHNLTISRQNRFMIRANLPSYLSTLNSPAISSFIPANNALLRSSAISSTLAVVEGPTLVRSRSAAPELWWIQGVYAGSSSTSVAVSRVFVGELERCCLCVLADMVEELIVNIVQQRGSSLRRDVMSCSCIVFCVLRR